MTQRIALHFHIDRIYKNDMMRYFLGDVAVGKSAISILGLFLKIQLVVSSIHGAQAQVTAHAEDPTSCLELYQGSVPPDDSDLFENNLEEDEIRPWILSGTKWKKGRPISLSSGIHSYITDTSYDSRVYFGNRPTEDESYGSRQGHYVFSQLGLKTRPFRFMKNIDIEGSGSVDAAIGRIGVSAPGTTTTSGDKFVDAYLLLRATRRHKKSKDFYRVEVYVNGTKEGNHYPYKAETTNAFLVGVASGRKSKHLALSGGFGFCAVKENANLAGYFDIESLPIKTRGNVTGVAAKTALEASLEKNLGLFKVGLGTLLNLVPRNYAVYLVNDSVSPGKTITTYDVVSESANLGVAWAEADVRICNSCKNEIRFISSIGYVTPLSLVHYIPDLDGEIHPQGRDVVRTLRVQDAKSPNDSIIGDELYIGLGFRFIFPRQK